MMKSFIGERGSGKTTALIKESHETGKYILVSNRIQAAHIFKAASKLGFKIPYPITLLELMSRGIYKHIRREGVLVDEAPTILEQVLDAKIHMFTATQEEVSDD